MCKVNKTVYVIGSIKQHTSIKRIATYYSDIYKNVLYVSAEHDESLTHLVKKSFDRIEEADIIVAVKKPNNTFGEAVTFELEYARRLHKMIISHQARR